MMSFDIAAAINKKLAEIPHLPCRVDQMTAREVEIFKSLSVVVGFLEFLKSEAESDPSPWSVGNSPEPGWYIVTSKYRNPNGQEVTETSPMEWSGQDWLEPEEFTSWKKTKAEIVAWMPLPEPYQGRGDDSLVHRIVER